MNEKDLRQFILQIYIDLVNEYAKYSAEEIPQYEILPTIRKIEEKLKEII